MASQTIGCHHLLAFSRHILNSTRTPPPTSEAPTSQGEASDSWQSKFTSLQYFVNLVAIIKANKNNALVITCMSINWLHETTSVVVWIWGWIGFIKGEEIYSSRFKKSKRYSDTAKLYHLLNRLTDWISRERYVLVHVQIRSVKEPWSLWKRSWKTRIYTSIFRAMRDKQQCRVWFLQEKYIYIYLSQSVSQW